MAIMATTTVRHHQPQEQQHQAVEDWMRYSEPQIDVDRKYF